MAMTVNPAVSGVSYRRWTLHLGMFVAGVAGGALLTYAVVHALYTLLALASPAAWLLVALPVVALAALRDLGVKAPVPYPTGRQVPAWLRHMVAPSVAAVAYGAQLGVGFLTNFTYSTHTAFVALLATQAQIGVVGAGVLAFSLSKSIVLVTSLTPRSEHRFLERFQNRLPRHGRRVLRLASAAFALATAVALIVNL